MVALRVSCAEDKIVLPARDEDKKTARLPTDAASLIGKFSVAMKVTWIDRLSSAAADVTGRVVGPDKTLPTKYPCENVATGAANGAAGCAGWHPAVSAEANRIAIDRYPYR
jgi:hypothetical protein